MRLALHIGGREQTPALGAAGGGTVDGALPIGEPGLEVLSCPGCNRPLRTGSRRCSNCGMRFLAGVQLRRATILLVVGFAAGLTAGGSIVTAGVMAGLPGVVRPPAQAEVPAAPAAGKTDPSATAPAATPSASVVVVTAPARSALRQTAVVNDRLAQGGVDLDAALAASSFDPAATATVIRVIASEAATGADQLARLATWPRAAALASDLRAFYDELRTTARSGLANSITNSPAYRTTAEALRTTLGRLPDLDARLAVLLEVAALESRP